METGITVISPTSLAEAKEMSSLLSKSNLLAEAFRGKEADVLMTIMLGAELGLRPMQALMSFDVIKGKQAMKPVAMIALVRAHASIEEIDCVESTALKAVWESRRKGSNKTLSTTFTMENAKAAGLSGNDNYRKWPEQMLQWRCAAMHCRKFHSDITLGMYSTEEVESFDAPKERPINSPPAAIRQTTPQTSGQMVDALKQSIATLPASNTSARNDLFAAIHNATTLLELNALVPEMSELKMTPTDELRIEWGRKRDTLKANERLSGVEAPTTSVVPE